MPGTAQLANASWEALLGAHAALMKEFMAEGIWTEVSMREYDVLYTLSKCREPIRLGDLHHNVLLSQPALSRMVDRLANRGLVAREPDPVDARRVLLSLTDEGRGTQRRIGRRHARSVAALLSARLTGAEMTRLGQICLRLARPGEREDQSSRPRGER